MPAKTGSRNGLKFEWALGENNWNVGMDDNLKFLDRFGVQLSFKSFLNTPPSTPSAGDSYVVGPAPTGVWAGKANQVAVYDQGAWAYGTPRTGWLGYCEADGTMYVFDTSWVASSGGGGQQSVTFDRLAGTPMSALIAVWENTDGEVYPLDYQDAAHIDLLAGITTTAAPTTGVTIQVQLSGVLDISGLGLSPGPVWLGANGALTQVPPEDGFDVLVGRVVNDQRLYISFTDPIHLED